MAEKKEKQSGTTGILPIAEGAAESRAENNAAVKGVSEWDSLREPQYQFGTAASDEKWLQRHGAGEASSASDPQKNRKYPGKDDRGETSRGASKYLGREAVRDASEITTDSGTENESVDPYAVTDEMRSQATAGIDHKIKNTEDWLKSLDAPEDADKRAERERKERNKKRIMAVSDGLRALGNLFFTSRYSPNMYDHQRSQVGRVAAQQEKEQQKREKNDADYLRFSLALGDYKNDRDKILRNLEEQQERRKQAAKRAEHDQAAADRTAELFPLQKEEQDANRRKAVANATMAEVKAGNAATYEELKNETERTKALANKGKATHYYNGGGSKKVHHFRGKSYESDKDYAKEVFRAVDEWNRTHSDKQIKLTEKYNNGRSGNVEKLIAAERLAGTLEMYEDEERAKKKSPTGKGNSKKSPTA